MSTVRLDKWKVLLAFGAGLAIVVVVANVVVLLSTPGAPTAPCSTGPACPPPVAPIALGVPWTSTELGYSFQYDDRFTVVSQDGRGVRLRFPFDQSSSASARKVSFSEVAVTAVPASEGTPQQLLDRRKDELSQQILGLEADDHSGTTILGPSIGHLDGVGGSYVGTFDSAQGPTAPATVALIAAGNERVSAVFTYVLVGSLDADETTSMRETADLVLSTFRWPA
ncbi:MAG TPA: hypothetical protein VEP49_09630 [Acidimicrobiia bacterium]|nr:hypothetical protein [Acidimicrobiia bacterium]